MTAMTHVMTENWNRLFVDSGLSCWRGYNLFALESSSISGVLSRNIGRIIPFCTLNLQWWCKVLKVKKQCWYIHKMLIRKREFRSVYSQDPSPLISSNLPLGRCLQDVVVILHFAIARFLDMAQYQLRFHCNFCLYSS